MSQIIDRYVFKKKSKNLKKSWTFKLKDFAAPLHSDAFAFQKEGLGILEISDGIFELWFNL